MIDIKQLLDNLDGSLIVRYQAVNDATNPVSIAFDEYEPDGRLYILMQYSLFSRYIVRFLIEVLYRTSMGGHGLVAAEMQRNLLEELADGESGLPHYVLLINGYWAALNRNVYDVEPSEATRRFEESMLAGIHGGDSAFAAGVAYALESSAVPELRMTRTFVDRLFHDLGKPVPREIQSFFGSHIGEIEVLHQGRLREASMESFSTAEEFASYAAGFDMAMTSMDNWWRGLAREVQAPVERQVAEACELNCH